MFEINLLKNNIPKKIDIPKKSKVLFVKFLFISLIVILALSVTIFAGFYFAKKETKNQIENLKNHTLINNIEKIKKTAKFNNTNNTFSVTVKLQNATLNKANATIAIIHQPKTEPKTEKSESIKPNPQVKEVVKIQNPQNKISNPVEMPKIIQKSCVVLCGNEQLNNLKSILGQKHISYIVRQIENYKYNYLIYVGGMDRSKFLVFENVLKAKGYNIVGVKIINGKYYANLGQMSESDKNKFLSAWSNLGFDIIVDKQKEISNKRYEIKFLCGRDVYEDLKQNGFNISAGRGADW